jgi:hypothetical protein
MVIVVEGKFRLLLFAFRSYLYLFDLLLNALLPFIPNRIFLLTFIMLSMDISVHL